MSTETKPHPVVVIMAGGFGLRLRPLTEQCPKPLLQVQGKPVLERILEQLIAQGFNAFCFALHYHAEKISSYFGDGSTRGIRIDYLIEEKPLGTAGALALIGQTDRRLLVINGDLVATVDFNDMLRSHLESGAAATVAVRKHEFTIPLGVVECAGSQLLRITEKPVSSCLVNAGIYVLEPQCIEFIPESGVCDMPTLIESVIAAGRTVNAYSLTAAWLDIGEPNDYVRADSALVQL